MDDHAWFTTLLRWATHEPSTGDRGAGEASGVPRPSAERDITCVSEPRSSPLPTGCRVPGAVHLGARTSGVHLSLHVRPDPDAWRRLTAMGARGSLGELSFTRIERGAAATSPAPLLLTLAMYQAARDTTARDKRLGLPASAGTIVQVDKVAYDGLGTCTRSLRFDPDGAGELRSELRLLWRLGPDVDVLLSAQAPRADHLFGALPDLDHLADSVQICGARPAATVLRSSFPHGLSGLVPAFSL